MTTSVLCYLIIDLNGLVDEDRHKGVTLAEVKQHIEKGDVFEWLENKFGGAIQRIYREAPCAEELTKGLRECISGREGKKLRVHNNGICLLIAYAIELIQRNDTLKA